MSEAWRFVPGSDTHEVSNLGRVRSWVTRFGAQLDRPRAVRTRRCLGYLMVSVRIGGKPVARYLHRLVLETFGAAECPIGMICCHFPDPNPHHCSYDNLRWDTRLENGRDASAHYRGAAAVQARLDELRAMHPHLRSDIEGLTFRTVEPAARNRQAARIARMLERSVAC